MPYANSAVAKKNKESNPAEKRLILSNAIRAKKASTKPPTTPKTICEKISQMMELAERPPPLVLVMTEIMMTVSMYEHGSLLPLSTSRTDAVLFFRPNLRERRVENTEAASVEANTDPKRKLSVHFQWRA